MSKNIHLTQWKSSGSHQPCCKFEDGKWGFTRRNKKIRHLVRSMLRNEAQSSREFSGGV